MEKEQVLTLIFDMIIDKINEMKILRKDGKFLESQLAQESASTLWGLHQVLSSDMATQAMIEVHQDLRDFYNRKTKELVANEIYTK